MQLAANGVFGFDVNGEQPNALLCLVKVVDIIA
jgi:hypothetical protein